MNRKIYHVVRGVAAWHVRRDRARRSDSCHENKTKAIARAKALASRRGVLGQVIVHGRNGRIQTERTYGNDPRRTRG